MRKALSMSRRLQLISVERILDSSKKWNLKNYLDDKLNAM